MKMILMDIVEDCYRLLASHFAFSDFLVSSQTNPTLESLQIPRVIPAGTAMKDLSGNIYIATDTLYMYATESVTNVVDVASNGASWINDTLSTGIDTAISILQTGLSYVYYAVVPPSDDMPNGTPQSVIDAKDQSQEDSTGIWSWDIPQIADGDYTGRWTIAAMSKYRDGGILRPQYGWLWSNTALDEYSIITRCLSHGPFEVCDGYYGIYNPTLGYYELPGPTYPMGYYHISLDPYAEQSTIDVDDYYPGIDISLDSSYPYVTTSVFLPEPTNPIIYRFPGPAYELPDSNSKGRALTTVPMSLLDVCGMRHIGEILSSMGLSLVIHSSDILTLDGDILTLDGDILTL